MFWWCEEEEEERKKKAETGERIGELEITPETKAVREEY